MSKSLFARLGVAALTLAVAACVSDTTSAPPAPAVQPPAAGASHTLLLQPEAVKVLQRTTPLANPITVSKTIGLLGGTISVPAAGLTVVFLPGAVLQSTSISVTALAGSNVAYEFSPHGTQFLVPVVATQSLKGTNISGLNLLNFFAGYYQNASDIGSNGIATITEILNVSVNLLNQVVVFNINHFSGYIIATGCDADGSSQ